MTFALLNPCSSSAAAVFSSATTTAPDMASAVRGAILLADPPGRMEFRFAYGEVPVTGLIVPEDSERYVLSVRATAGIVPYSAEDPEARGLLLEAIHHIAGTFNECILVDPHQSIVVTDARTIAHPLTAVGVLSGLVALMVEVRPVFEALAEYLPDLRSALPEVAAV